MIAPGMLRREAQRRAGPVDGQQRAELPYLAGHGRVTLVDVSRQVPPARGRVRPVLKKVLVVRRARLFENRIPTNGICDHSAMCARPWSRWPARRLWDAPSSSREFHLLCHQAHRPAWKDGSSPRPTFSVTSSGLASPTSESRPTGWARLQQRRPPPGRRIQPSTRDSARNRIRAGFTRTGTPDPDRRQAAGSAG
jgi:hypothetical protein